MTVVIYAAACLAFCASFALLHIVLHARQEIGRLWVAVSELGAPELTVFVSATISTSALIIFSVPARGSFQSIGTVNDHVLSVLSITIL